MNMDQFFTIAEVADRLKFKPSTIRTWIRSGRLAARRIGRSSVRISESSIARFLRAASPSVEDLPCPPPR